MPQPRIPLIFAGIFIAGAICINLSWIHGRHDADSLLMSLISIEQWTPYYWGDNRFGALLPLVVSVVRSYVPNLLVQTQLSICAALLTAVLFQCFFLDRERGFTARNLSSACLTVGLATVVFRPHDRVVQVFMLPSHPYFLSLSLALTGLIALLRFGGRPTLRYCIAVIALLLSFWVNWTNGPVIAGLALLLPSDAKNVTAHLRARAPALLLICVTLAAMYSFSLRYPRLMITGIAPFSEVPNTLSLMLKNVTGDMLYPMRLAILISAALLAAAVRWPNASLRRMFWPGEAHVITAIAVSFAIAVASTEWVMKNAYEWRYWTVPVVLIFLVLASFVADSIYLLLQGATASSVAAAAIAVLLFAAAIIRIFGLPSVERALASIDAVSGVHYAKIERLGCTHMIGDYWIAWSSVFYNRSHDIQPPLWAVSLRSETTEHLWSRIPPAERRYCGVCGDRMNNYYEIVFKLAPLRHTGQADNLCVFQK
jgi:hypothetical protein